MTSGVGCVFLQHLWLDIVGLQELLEAFRHFFAVAAKDRALLIAADA